MRRRRCLPVAWLVAPLLVAACGADDPDTRAAAPTMSASPSASPTGTPRGVAARPVAQILTLVRRAAARAGSVHVVAHSADRTGVQSIDLRVGPAGAVGVVALGEGDDSSELTLVRRGATLFLRAPEGYWREAGRDRDAVALAGRWVAVRADAEADVGPLTRLDTLVAGTLSAAGQWVKGPTGTVDGTDVFTLADTDLGAGGVVSVAATGPPLLRRYVTRAQGGVVADFLDWGAPVRVPSPHPYVDLTR